MSPGVARCRQRRSDPNPFSTRTRALSEDIRSTSDQNPIWRQATRSFNSDTVHDLSAVDGAEVDQDNTSDDDHRPWTIGCVGTITISITIAIAIATNSDTTHASTVAELRHRPQTACIHGNTTVITPQMCTIATDGREHIQCKTQWRWNTPRTALNQRKNTPTHRAAAVSIAREREYQ
ncbi:hypothetical protein [Natronocalculus amylovorans]|uniref:Uncharacterized protein n=1 Tax=Natronocalculus amylovorans TaxID=2917812 RepID=A0AAE3FZR5_9EURY|nr:hypothetical protein [Natronocalculus amylovorans]MCL9818377.1 hypothetical protein [Natronocalculus amylovorans]